MKSEKDYQDLLSNRRFDPKAKIKPDKIYFTIGDSNVVGTAGNFICFSGLPKAGKSTYISAAIASFIGQKKVFTFNLNMFPGKDRICLFDTEQSNFDFMRTVKNISRMADVDDVWKNFDAFLLREDSSLDILRLINSYLKSVKNCGVLIIDGILDCIDNFNDEGASKKLIRVLKRWASMHDCLIITVLHTSKQSGNTLGHYGSASDRYAQSTLTIEKTKIGSFNLKEKFLRSCRGIEDIEIRWDEFDNCYKQL